MVRLKVTNAVVVATPYLTFQFLMVRLKVAKVETKKAILEIFQFLMVRLKDDITEDFCNEICDFNSLWCD